MSDLIYTPDNWFWIVGGDETRFYSSAARDYVTELPMDAGVTRIASEEELWAVLKEQAPVCLPDIPAFVLERFQTAIQAHIDEAAREKQYENGFACATYINSNVPQWAAEASAFVAWRDAVWAYAYAELDKVMNSERAAPTVEAFLDELPAIVWPSSE